MLKPRGRNFDNVSVAHTKSSKTLKSKLNNNPEIEIKKFEPPYFKEDLFLKEIEVRVKKENQKSEGIFGAKKIDHLYRANKIVEDLLSKHRQAKKKLEELKKQAEDKTKQQCPFQPDKKKLDKFVVEGNVIRRNEMW